MAGTKNRARKPRDYIVAGAWPYATIDHHAARVAQTFARRLEELVKLRQLSAKRLAAASTADRQTVANVLAGKVWADILTMANVEAAVGVPLYPGLNEVDPPGSAPPRTSMPTPAASMRPGGEDPDAGLLGELEELFLGHGFAAAPWRVWLGTERSGAEPGDRVEPAGGIAQRLQVLEHLPFVHPRGHLTSLHVLSEDAGWAVREMVLALCEAEDAGELGWDGATQRVSLTD
ncbi:hypothetical protein AB0L06_42415 [Spirillospora sp. NPDC052269]